MKKIFFLFAFSCLVKSAIACDCPPIQQNIQQQSRTYAVIFEGKVDSVSVISGKYASVYFNVSELFKGKSYAESQVRFDCSTSCQLNFTPKETWIIYANYYKYGELEIKFCSRSRKLIADTTQDYYSVNNGMSFKNELAFLQKNFGSQPLLNEDTIALQHEEEAQRLTHPTGVQALWLVGISFVVVTAFLYFFNKYFK
ncbi:MAG: hypothetical protein ABI199_01870 [Bacteroidia bacterium]